MANKMNYDQAIKRVQEIVSELEQTQALSVAVYKQKAQEAQQLLTFCEAQLCEMESALADNSDQSDKRIH